MPTQSIPNDKTVKEFLSNYKKVLDGESYKFQTTFHQKGDIQLWAKTTQVKKFKKIEVDGKKKDALDADGNKIFDRFETVVTDILKYNGKFYTYSFTKLSEFSNMADRGGESKTAGLPANHICCEYSPFCEIKALYARKNLDDLAGSEDVIRDLCLNGSRLPAAERERVMELGTNEFVADFRERFMRYADSKYKANGQAANAFGGQLPWGLIKECMDTRKPETCVLPFASFVTRLSEGCATEDYEMSPAFVYTYAMAVSTRDKPFYVQEFQSFDNRGLWHIEGDLTTLLDDYVNDRNTSLVSTIDSDADKQAIFLKDLKTAMLADDAGAVHALFTSKFVTETNKMGWVCSAVGLVSKREFMIADEVGAELAGLFKPGYAKELRICVPVLDLEEGLSPFDVFQAIDEVEAGSPPKMARTMSARTMSA